MKTKRYITGLIPALLFTLILSSNGKESETMNKTPGSPSSKILIAYFSRTGNTRTMARQIKQATGGELFEIIPATPYPEAYRDVLAQSKKEIEAGFHPELKNDITDIDQYNVIFIGSPNWYQTIAPPVASFLAGHNLADKTVVPFLTHGGGGQGSSANDIKELCPDSTVLELLPVYGSSVKDAQDEVNAWLRGMGFSIL
jgi:flavodoxin